MKTKKLIYCCISFNERYSNLLKLLAISLKSYGNIQSDTDILVLTEKSFEQRVKNIFKETQLDVIVHILQSESRTGAFCSRLFIFDYPKIHLYDKILYLDIDTLVTGDLSSIFNMEIQNKLYGLKEGKIDHSFWGSQFFDFTKINRNTEAFSSAILFFNNCNEIKLLFSKILKHIQKHNDENKPMPDCLDQPFIVYHAVMNNMYNNTDLIGKATNDPNTRKNEVISHFSGDIGKYECKIGKMQKYLNRMLNKIDIYTKNGSLKSVPKKLIDKIVNNEFTMLSRERLINLYFQCSKFRNTSYSFVECGTGKGGALAIMKYVASENNQVFGFDSFEKMPDTTDKDIGDGNKCNPKAWVGVNISGGIENVYNTFNKLNIGLNNVYLIKGYFEDTLHKNKSKLKNIAVLRVDCDWYEPVKRCLDELYEQVIEGGTIIIDDYDFFIGAKKATDEFRKKHNITSPLIETHGGEFYWVKRKQIDA